MKISGRTKSAKAPTFDADGYQTNLTDLNRTPLPALKKVKVRPSSWGGARPGAGRKSSGRQPVLLRLTPATLRTLRGSSTGSGRCLLLREGVNRRRVFPRRGRRGASRRGQAVACYRKRSWLLSDR